MGYPSDVPPSQGHNDATRAVRLILVFLFLVTLLTALISAVNLDESDAMYAQFFTDWVVHILGAFLAVTAGLSLLLLGVSGSGPERSIALLPALLGGLLLMEVHWSLALALGAIATAQLVISGLPMGRRVSSDGSAASPR